MTTFLNEERARDIQLWLWHNIEMGWDPCNHGRATKWWSREDTDEARLMGWMLADIRSRPEIEESPSIPKYDLFSLTEMHRWGTAELMDTIRRAAPVIPICGKAVSLLAASRMQYPDYPFNFLRLENNDYAIETGQRDNRWTFPPK